MEPARSELEQPQRARGLPVRRYLVWLPVAAVGFMLLAMADQWQTFASLFGIEPASPVDLALSPEVKARAEQAVREFNAALEGSYRAGSVTADDGALLSTELRDSLERELEFVEAHRLPFATTSSAIAFRESRALPDESIEVVTEEVWTSSAAVPGRRSRLRFRYRVRIADNGTRVESMRPIMPRAVPPW